MSHRLAPLPVVLCVLLVGTAFAAPMRVMPTGLGSGRVRSTPAGIDCGATCDFNFAAGSVTLEAFPDADSEFEGWNRDDDAVGPSPDCSGGGPTERTCVVSASVARAVKAKFRRRAGFTIPALVAAQPDAITPQELQTFLTTNPNIRTPAQFIAALPEQYRSGWLLMTRSESLQTGTAQFPRVILTSTSAKSVFTIALAPDDSFPRSQVNAIEYMQYDAAAMNFRFHEIRLDVLPDGSDRRVEFDDTRCTKCHSTRNVFNRGLTPGTDGVPVNTIKAKNKPNWDTYDSWGGLLAFNRDRIHRGSVEAAAFRKLLNPWTWRNAPGTRQIFEQLKLQPDGVNTRDVIRRVQGGVMDGTPTFVFDGAGPPAVEPEPRGPVVSSAYSFDRYAGTSFSMVQQSTATDYAQLFAPRADGRASSVDEGRGVELFDNLTALNARRIGDEVAHHRWATGSVPIDVRPLALAIAKGCLTTNATGRVLKQATGTEMTFNSAFFDARVGMTLGQLYTDTDARLRAIPRRKADIQRHNLDRSGDLYVTNGGPREGLIQRYGSLTSSGTSTAMSRLRQEVFQRPIELPSFPPDQTGVLDGLSVDREDYAYNLPKVALFRYFLEPLGVSVDKWSTSVRGRSRSYTFADLLDDVVMPAFIQVIENNLGADPIPTLAAPYACESLLDLVQVAIGPASAVLPVPEMVPTFTDVQRILNKSCIECHGGLGYPPYVNHGNYLNFSENPGAGLPRRTLSDSHELTSSLALSLEGPLFDRITRGDGDDEDCPNGVMPCGGPSLSQTDIETIRRWILGGAPFTEGDPHLQTIDGIRYDFQSAGEFTLFREEGLEVQIRNIPVQTERPVSDAYSGLNACASVTTAVAMQVGPHRISYQPAGPQKPPELRVDGALVQSIPGELRLAQGGRLLALPTSGFRLETPGGTKITITQQEWTYYGIHYLNVNIQQGRGTEGLIGSVAPGNWLPALPNGNVLGAKPSSLESRYKQLYETFEQAWRVNSTTSLFRYAAGESTASYSLPWWPKANPLDCTVGSVPPQIPVKPPLKTIPLPVAQQMCGQVIGAERRQRCATDVSITGEPKFADGYLAIEVNERNRAPLPATLLAPADLATVYGGTTLAWKATTDPEANPVGYRLCVWDSDVKFNINMCGPRLTGLSQYVSLTKNASYFWKVLAEDGRGASSESRTWKVTVR